MDEPTAKMEKFNRNDKGRNSGKNKDCFGLKSATENRVENGAG